MSGNTSSINHSGSGKKKGSIISKSVGGLFARSLSDSSMSTNEDNQSDRTSKTKIGAKWSKFKKRLVSFFVYPILVVVCCAPDGLSDWDWERQLTIVQVQVQLK